jgi:hypothetical protein
MMAILTIVILTLIVDKREMIFIISTFPLLIFILFGGYPLGNMKVQYYGEYFTPLLYFLILMPPFFTNKDHTVKIHPNSSENMPMVRNRGVILFILLVVVFGLFYNPYGPFNNPNLPGTNAYAHFSEEINVTPVDKIANSFVKLVPSNATILVQDNEPQFSNRPKNFLFGPGNLPWLNESFFYDKGPTPASTIPQYIAVDVCGVLTNSGWYNFWFYNSTDGSMSTWFPYFYSHYHYGLLAYAYPFYLYKLNYTGQSVISSELNMIKSEYVVHENAPQLHVFNENENMNNIAIPGTIYKTFLLPANYQFAFNFTGESISGTISLVATNGCTVFAKNYLLSNLSGEDKFTVNFTVYKPSDYTFTIFSSNLKGKIVSYNSECLSLFEQSTQLLRPTKTLMINVSNPSNLTIESMPIMIKISSKEIDNANNSLWTNIAFYNNSSPIPSWLETYNMTVATFWVKVNTLLPLGSENITLMAFNKSSSEMNGLSVGEAPDLSRNYGQFDNGVYVFGNPTGSFGYYNFIGNNLPTGLMTISGGFGLPGGSLVVDNGLIINGYSNGKAYEAVGTTNSIPNSVTMGWGFASTVNSSGLYLNGPSLGGYTDQIYASNFSSVSTVALGNQSSNYKYFNLSHFSLQDINNVAISYGTNSSSIIYANGRTFTFPTPDFVFKNYVGGTIAYTASNYQERFSPEIFYFFVIPNVATSLIIKT